MNTTKFELRKNTIEISYKNRNEISEGCTLNQDNQEPEIIKAFDNKEEAFVELGKYTTEVIKLSGSAGAYYSITEYYVEENSYDEDNEWASGGDVWRFSKMDKSVIEG